MLSETGVDGVSVARGAIGNPWIYIQARALLAGKPLPDPPPVAEQARVIRAHFELSVAAHGEVGAARMMRKFGIKYSELHPFGRDVRHAFFRVNSPAAWRAVLDEWYDPGRDWPPARHKRGPGHLVAAGARLRE
jgi:tRNA-dihydrouridine synthase